MLVIPCPWCGPRAEIEFTYGGDAETSMPALDGQGDAAAWLAFVYPRRNPAGPHRELWHHTFGCGQWFPITRNTVTNEFLDRDCAESGEEEA
jgi:heterotetrameric sarcosine oxidase delta subunit